MLLVYAHVRALGAEDSSDPVDEVTAPLFPRRCVYNSFRCILIVFVDCYSNRTLAPAFDRVAFP